MVSLDFPADESDTQVFTVLLKSGVRPTGGTVSSEAKPLKPGGTVALSVEPKVVEGLKRLVQEQGRGKALKMNRAKVYAQQVYFDANTMWMLGTTSVRDPVTGEWKAISQGNAKTNHSDTG